MRTTRQKHKGRARTEEKRSARRATKKAASTKCTECHGTGISYVGRGGMVDHMNAHSCTSCSGTGTTHPKDK